MVRAAACTALMLCLFVLTAKAEPAAARHTVGFGAISDCAEWQHEGLTQGKNWILGYWSGRNVENGEVGNDGKTLDDKTIIKEVTLVCKEDPTLGIAKAVDKVYEQHSKE